MTPTRVVRRPRFLHVLTAVALVEITVLTAAVAVRNRRDARSYAERAAAKALAQADLPDPGDEPPAEAPADDAPTWVPPVPMPSYPGFGPTVGHVIPLPAHPYLVHINSSADSIDRDAITRATIRAHQQHRHLR